MNTNKIMSLGVLILGLVALGVEGAEILAFFVCGSFILGAVGVRNDFKESKRMLE